LSVCDTGAKRNLLGHQGQGLAEPHAVAEARAINAAEAFLFEALSEFQGGLTAPGNGGQTDGGFAHGVSPPDLVMRGFRAPTASEAQN
jgi:hypothetical protein